MKRTSDKSGAAPGLRPPQTEVAVPDASPVGAAATLPLSRAKAYWVFGDWDLLATLRMEAVASHPERERLALLVACAHQQNGDHVRAREFVRQALAWGCDHRLAARLLASGLHNTLGRIGALKADDAMLERHFKAAMDITEDAESRAATHTRAVRELARLGLLPQAARLLGDELAHVGLGAARPVELGARLEVLRSSMNIIEHELSLAHNRHQAHANVRLEAGVGPPGGAAGLAEGELRDALRRRSTSQLGQDLWVLERTGYKRGGFFVEFGATDGVRLSNSLLLEREFDWAGICAEPNPRMYAQLVRNRRCVVSDACIGPHTGEEVEFVLADEFGGMLAHIDEDMHAARRRAYLADPANRATLRTESLNDLLLRLGAPRTIDYISVDTEGSEFEILRDFPFADWDVRRLTIEHNFGPARPLVRGLMARNGYRCIESQWEDWYERDDAPEPDLT